MNSKAVKHIAACCTTKCCKKCKLLHVASFNSIEIISFLLVLQIDMAKSANVMVLSRALVLIKLTHIYRVGLALASL